MFSSFHFRFDPFKRVFLLCVAVGVFWPNSTVTAQTSLRDDPRFREYQMGERARTPGAESVGAAVFQPVQPTPTPAPRNLSAPVVKVGATPPLEPIEGTPGQEKAGVASEGADLLYVPSGKRRDIPAALPWVARHEVERITPSEARNDATGRSRATVSRAPMVAVLDLEHTRAVEPTTADSLSQVVWNAAQRVRSSQLQNRAYTQRILAEQGLTATDPYKVPPTPRQMATALGADYLIGGNLNKIEGVFVVELQLYSAVQDRVVSSLASEAVPTPEALLNPIRDQVQKLMASVPGAVLVNPSTGGTEPLKVSAFKPETSASKKAASQSERSGTGKKSTKEQKRVVTKSKPAPKPTPKSKPLQAVKPVEEAPGAGDAEKPEGVFPYPTPEPTPAPEVVAPQPTPAPTPTPTPAAAKATPAAEKTPSPAPDDPKKKAREAYEKAGATPKDSQEGLEAVREAVRLDPGNEEYEGELLQRLYQTGKYAEAAELGKRVAVLSNDANVLLYASAAHAALGQHQTAIDVLDVLLKKQPKNGFALYNKAVSLTYLDTKKAAEAFQVYLNACKNDPEQAAWVQDAQQKLQQLQGGDGKGQ